MVRKQHVSLKDLHTNSHKHRNRATQPSVVPSTVTPCQRHVPLQSGINSAQSNPLHSGKVGDEKISVVLVTHDRLNLFKATLNSFFDSATDDMYELIIVDDCSKQATRKWITTNNIDKKRHVTYLRNRKNRGVSYSTNRGIKAAAYKIVMTLPDDFLLAPGWMPKMMKIMKKENADIVFIRINNTHLRSPDEPYSKASKRVSKIRPYRGSGTMQKTLGDVVYIRIKSGVPFGNGSMLIHKEVFRKFGMFPEFGPRWGYNDAEFLQRISGRVKACGIIGVNKGYPILPIHIGHGSKSFFSKSRKRADKRINKQLMRKGKYKIPKLR